MHQQWSLQAPNNASYLEIRGALGNLVPKQKKVHKDYGKFVTQLQPYKMITLHQVLLDWQEEHATNEAREQKQRRAERFVRL
jgi:hypothetical protein